MEVLQDAAPAVLRGWAWRNGTLQPNKPEMLRDNWEVGRAAQSLSCGGAEGVHCSKHSLAQADPAADSR